MDSDRLRLILDTALDLVGLPLRGYVGGAALAEATAALSPDTRAKCGIDEARGAVVAALPYGEGPAEEPAWARDWSGPRAGIAHFARANWYGELAARLKGAAASARADLAAAGAAQGPSRAWRYFVNSRLPEKRLALLAGLGRIGRNSLLMVEGAGPGSVLGLLLLPFDPSPEASEPASHEPGASCGSCRACVEACPTGALSPEGGFERQRCLQHWSTVEGRLPPGIEAAWGQRLYGCDACLEACPAFKPTAAFATELGRLGSGLPVSWLAASSDEEIRGRLAGSALGRGWIPPSALRRNASLAARAAK